MSTVKGIIILMACIFANPALAVCTNGYCKGKLSFFSINPTGAYLMVETPDMEKMDCDLRLGKYMTLKKNHPNYASLFAGLFSAKSLRQEVLVRIYEGSEDCEISYINI